MSGVLLHPDAITDIEEIWEFIAADNLDAADNFLQEIYEAIQALVSFPYLGHGRPDLTSKPLRFQIVRELLIAYSLYCARESDLAEDKIHDLVALDVWLSSRRTPTTLRRSLHSSRRLSCSSALKLNHDSAASRTRSSALCISRCFA